MNTSNSNSMQALMLKPTEAARIAGVSTRTITRMAEQGQIRAVRMRRSWRINRAAFLEKLGIGNEG